MGAKRTDKDTVHLDYISSDISLRALAKKHKVADSTVRRWAKEEGWAAEKQEFVLSAAQQARANMRAAKAQLLTELTDRTEKVYLCADKLLLKVDQLLNLEDALAPRDLKSISSVLVDVMTMQNIGKSDDDEDGGGAVEIRLTGELEDWAG